MKKSLTSLEIHAIVKELQSLVNGKLDKISQPQKKQLLLHIHVTNRGRHTLLLAVPNFMYITSHRFESPEKPYGFCMLLRKYISNARLRRIEQLGVERIVEFLFETKDAKYRIIVELFSKGNIILCKEDYTIISPLETQTWRDRTIKPGIKYKAPKKSFNFFKPDKTELKKLLSQEKELVLTLAKDLGFGGTYAEELCLLSSIDKKKKYLADDDVKRLFEQIKKITTRKTTPAIVYEDDAIKDIIPFPLKIYDIFNKKSFKSYNEALDTITYSLILSEEKSQTLQHEKEVQRLKKAISIQEVHLKSIEKSIKDNTRKAELIYEHYNLIKEIIPELNKALKKYSWKEVEEKLKGHKIIKQMNSKNKTVLLEV
jgi:predicted ribosome quality control (RQC) complex YloA/Tae2 family protein